jgi:hypothetical protein
VGNIAQAVVNWNTQCFVFVRKFRQCLIQLEVYNFVTHSLLLLEDHKMVALIAARCSNMAASVSLTLLS